MASKRRKLWKAADFRKRLPAAKTFVVQDFPCCHCGEPQNRWRASSSYTAAPGVKYPAEWLQCSNPRCRALTPLKWARQRSA